MEQIKLIWDFRGVDCHQIAMHHERHLSEYAKKANLTPGISGSEKINDFYAIAFLIVTREDLLQVRDALRPHRGELYQ
jgi:hypothetical protein